MTNKKPNEQKRNNLQYAKNMTRDFWGRNLLLREVYILHLYNIKNNPDISVCHICSTAKELEQNLK